MLKPESVRENLIEVSGICDTNRSPNISHKTRPTGCESKNKNILV